MELRVCMGLLAGVVGAMVVAYANSARADTRADYQYASAGADRPAPPAGGGIRVGALAGVGFPRPLAVEALVGVDRTIVIGAEYSFLPRSTIGGVDTTFWAIAGDARVFPFRSPFFVGIRGGHQRFAGSMSASFDTLGTFTDTVAIDTWFINPRVGVLFMWDSRLAIGIDAGLQIPTSSSVSSSLSSGLPQDARVTNATRQLTNVTDTLGASVVPTLDLLRVGLVL